MSNSQPANTKETTISYRLIFDEQHDQYLWLRCGWDGKKRVPHIIYTSRFTTVKSGWKKITET
jgi:XisI protein